MTKKSMMIFLMFWVAVNGMDLTNTGFGSDDQQYANNALVRMNRNNRTQNREQGMQQISDDLFGSSPNNNENPRICGRYEVIRESIMDNRNIRRLILDHDTGTVFEAGQDFERSMEYNYLNRERTITQKISEPFLYLKNAVVGHVKPLALEFVKAEPKCMHWDCKYPEKDDGEKGYKLIELGNSCKQHEGHVHQNCFFKYQFINHFGVCEPKEGLWSYVKEKFASVRGRDCKQVNQYAELTANNKFWVHVYDNKKITYFVATVFIIGLYVFNMWAHWGSGWYTPNDYNNWKPFTELEWTAGVDTIASISTLCALGHMFKKGMVVNFMNIISEKIMNTAGYVIVGTVLLQFIPGQVGTVIQAVILLAFAFYAWSKDVTILNITIQIMYFAWVISTLMMFFPTFGTVFKDLQSSGESAYNIISK